MELTDIEDRTEAQNDARREVGLIYPSVAGVRYEELATPCNCLDRTLYHGHEPGRRNHFYTLCQMHGVQDCGIARVKSQVTTADPDRQHRRRTSGYTTHAWYNARGK